MRTFLRFLFWTFIILLISGVVLSVNYLLDQPVETGIYALAAIFGAWLLFILIRRLYIRTKAKAQVKNILNKGQDDSVDDELGMNSSELSRSLKNSWHHTLKALKKSQLKLQGDPLYVLPWYMIFGRPTAGKSTSLRNANLLRPSIDLSEHKDGSTLNLEWWLYDEGILIDTAGRYAVPDRLERDRKEWDSLLSLISRHRQKEPLNGLVLAVAANRILEANEEDLLEEGRQVRNSINRLMDKLEVKVPIYLMVTKTDLVPGFNDWVDYLPEESRKQAMGFLIEENQGDLDSQLDSALDNVVTRLKEIRLLMLDQTEEPSDLMLSFPDQLEKVRDGLHIFIKTALKGNAYQEQPPFRGLYFSSSKQEREDKSSSGVFLHDFFTKVLPRDRGQLVNLPSALRIKAAFRRYALGLSGAITFISLVGLGALYSDDKAALDEIMTNYADSPLLVSETLNANDRLETAHRLKSLIDALVIYEENESLPWRALTGDTNNIAELKTEFLDFVKANIISRYDNQLRATIDNLKPNQTSSLAGGLVRRINILQSKITPEQEIISNAIGPDYLKVQDGDLSSESSELFNDVYNAYAQWTLSKVDLQEEKKRLQNDLLYLVKHNHGDYQWIVQWANDQDFDPVRLKDYWGGSYKINNPAIIQPAYTLAGYEFIQEFLNEFQMANKDDKQLSEIQEDFSKYYQRQYIASWMDFAERFDDGKLQQRDRKEWQTLLDRMATVDNPYFSLIESMHEQLSPFQEIDYNSHEQIAFFKEAQGFSISDGRKGRPNTKLVKKALGKLGKVGKVAKKAMKVHKKATKGQKGSDTDSVMEDAVVALDKYKQSLAELAFKADSRTQSLSSITTFFTSPDSPESGNGAAASAWAAIKELQALIGKPTSNSRLFWQLFTGPVNAAYDYMKNESSCELQSRWENNVLAAIEGVNSNQVGNLIVGEGGILWNYLDSEIKPFVTKQYRRGYVRSDVKQTSIGISEDLLDVLNQAEQGKFVVGNAFDVEFSALPSGANPGAKLQPYATFVDLHCSDGTQTLANYNYPTNHTFNWSLEKCGDTTLRIEIGQLTLIRNYNGVKGFGMFLREFQDGRHIFSAEDFPNMARQLKNKNVDYIDVNFVIKGQAPVIQMLDSVPLQLPQIAAHCW